MALWRIVAVHGWILLLSVPFQFLLLKTIWKFRKKDIFKSEFFKLLFSLTITDTIFCISCSFHIFILSFGPHHSSPRLMGTSASIIYAFGYAANVLGLAAIAANRAVNIVWFTRAELIWTSRTTKIALSIQWSIALGSSLSILHPGNHSLYLDLDEMPVMVNPNSSIAFATNVVTGMVGMLGSMLIVVCYAACLIKLLHHRATNGTAGGSFDAEIKLFIQGCLLSFFLIFGLVAYSLIYYFHCSTPICETFILAMSNACYFANFYMGSLIAFCMSFELRNHAKMILKGSNEVAVAPPAKRQAE